MRRYETASSPPVRGECRRTRPLRPGSANTFHHVGPSEVLAGPPQVTVRRGPPSLRECWSQTCEHRPISGITTPPKRSPEAPLEQPFSGFGVTVRHRHRGGSSPPPGTAALTIARASAGQSVTSPSRSGSLSGGTDGDRHHE